MNILILGANGFIGSHLCEAILAQTSYEIFAFDCNAHNLRACENNPRFHFYQGDMLKEKKWIRMSIKKSHVVFPLVAIATPASYVKTPLKVFELDFEANLQIVRWCVQYKKHLIFPSTSEVYGLCPDTHFDEEKSNFVTGPLHKERWAYASAKQLMDRIIYAYGKHEGLNYTLFRPFNWYGPRLDNNLDSKQTSRVLTQFIRNILQGKDILLVDGGLQKRSFTYIDDGINALLKIIENKNNTAYQKIFNLGNPDTHISIKDLALLLLEITNHPSKRSQAKIKETSGEDLYGAGYEDIPNRCPSIEKAKKYLNWAPTIDLKCGLRYTLKDYGLIEHNDKFEVCKSW